MPEVTYMPDYGHRFGVQRAAVKHVYDASARTTIMIMWAFLAILIFVIGERREAIIAVMARSLGESRADAIWSIGFLALSIAAALYLWFRIAPAIATKSLERVSPPQPLRFVANDEGLLWEGPDIRYSIGWPAVRHIFTTPDAVCFLVRDLVWFVPKNAFNGPDGVDTFLSFVLPRVPSNAQGGSA